MAFCSSCGSQLLEGASFCSVCGRNINSASDTSPAFRSSSAAGLSDNNAGALAYVTMIPAILFLLIDPYKQRRFVRFHAFQSIFLCVAALAVSLVLSLVSFLGFFSWIFFLLLVRLGFFVIWVVLVVNAAQGKMWELPILGSLAKQQADVESAGGPGQECS